MRTFLFSCFILASLVSVEAAESAIGRRVADFTLADFRGKQHSLADWRESKLVVLAFLGVECPLAKLYGPRLEKLQREYAAKGVTVVGIDANVQDSITEIAAYARVHELSFPILKDLANQLADRLGAQRTPEVFVLDAERVVRYRGRIDDQYGIGYVRDEPKQHDLRTVLDELLAGQPVSRPVVDSVGCHIGRVKQPKSDAPVTYANQIAPLLQKHCVECHRPGEIAPFALTDYSEVVGWAEMIAEVVREQRMPPWHADPRYGHFSNARRLTDDERASIARWVEDGAPEGPPSGAKSATEVATTGWKLPRAPDATFYISEKPFTVPAEGTVRYQWFSVETGFTEDRWISAAQILPGNRAVVHHVLAFVKKKGDRSPIGDPSGGHLVGYVPGLRSEPFPAGMAKKIPAGARLTFQVHYTPIGSVQLDRSQIGFVFTDPQEVTHEVVTMRAAGRPIAIPPHAANHRIEATSAAAPRELLLLSMMPHMHLRGKSFRYEAHLPDGRTETLLDVPHYDFNWQTSYRLAKPLPIPAGARMHCVAHYDNSENNLANPDPTKTVRWGDQTWEEMMLGYFDVALPIAAESRTESDDKARQEEKADSKPEAAPTVAGLLRLFDRNRDGKIARDEVPDRLDAAFRRLDRDGDNVVTVEELKRLK